MRKYFNKYTIFQLILFIVQSLNVAWCISNYNIFDIVTCIAIVADCYIFYKLIQTFMLFK